MRRDLIALTTAFGVFAGCQGEHVAPCSGATCGVDAGVPLIQPDASSFDGGSSIDAAVVDAGADASPADAGCPSVAGDHTRTLLYQGLLRTYYVHVPPGYDCAKPTPVVFNFHGFTSNAAEQISFTGMTAKADTETFIAVHPEGYLASWNAGQCCGQAAAQNLDDVGLTRMMLSQIEQAYNVDPRRVFSTGFSNGGFLSHRLGCEASDIIAAIAPVSGVMGIPTCNPTRSVPIIDFHGTNDPLVLYNGGGLTGFQSVPQSMSDWAQRDGCQQTTNVFLQTADTACVSYYGCPAGVSVELCAVDGGTHAWPGGPLGTTTINATDMLWAFFQGHPMPPPDGG